MLDFIICMIKQVSIIGILLLTIVKITISSFNTRQLDKDMFYLNYRKKIHS